MDDSTAIERCKAGDKDAFRHLVQRYQVEAMGHATAILADREDARDALQEAFIDAYQALRRFDTTRQFYPWFYTILRNRCFKLLSSRKRNAQPGLDEAVFIESTNEMRPEERLALEHALLDLSPTDREIVTLKHLDGLSYEELSERLDIPKGTVMSRLFHARRRLRENFALGPMRKD